MATIKTIEVPDIGDFSSVDVIEILVSPGDTISKDDSLIALETDKATMEVPAPFAGVVKSLKVKKGDKVSQGDEILTIECETETTASASEKTTDASETDSQSEKAVSSPSTTDSVEQTEIVSETTSTSIKTVNVPDIGDFSSVDVIEVLIAPGDTLEKDDSLIALETDKATMEVPAPFAGVVKSVKVKKGDKVSQGDEILTLEVTEKGASSAKAATTQSATPAFTASTTPASTSSNKKVESKAAISTAPSNEKVHAGPATRRLARELGVDLSTISGQGKKGRILTADVTAHVKSLLSQGGGASKQATGDFSVLPMPNIDFSQFGEIEVKPLGRIKQKSGANLHRNWVMLPHVTQFDEADITELEQFRQDNKKASQSLGIRLTPLAFFLKAAVCALKEYPSFNASLSSDNQNLIYKKYYHIGVAVDTPQGLVVPVVRDVDKKGVFQLARELDEISVRARDGKLTAADMQGSCFTISSLGGIGGTGFTPIINAPDVAIMGISKAKVVPQYVGEDIQPRRMLPFSLSYDHRVIDGAEAARFTSFFAKQLQDIRNMLL